MVWKTGANSCQFFKSVKATDDLGASAYRSALKEIKGDLSWHNFCGQIENISDAARLRKI